MAAESVISKAAGLFTRGAVTQLSADVYEVAGTHARYVVDRLAGGWRCSCPAGRAGDSSRVCSHVLAAAAVKVFSREITPSHVERFHQLAQQYYPDLDPQGLRDIESAALAEIIARLGVARLLATAAQARVHAPRAEVTR